MKSLRSAVAVALVFLSSSRGSGQEAEGLAPAFGERAATFRLEIVPDLVLCGRQAVLGGGHDVEDEFARKVRVELRAGTYLLSSAPSIEATIIDRVRYGPDREVARPVAAGEFQHRSASFTRASGNFSRHRFTYRQRFALASGVTLDVELADGIEFLVRNGVFELQTHVLDDADTTNLIAYRERFRLWVDGVPRVGLLTCSEEFLPGRRLEIETENDARLTVLAHGWHRSPLDDAVVMRVASATFEVGDEARHVNDYWDLAYLAEYSNDDRQYWLRLRPPVAIEGGRAPVHFVEVSTKEPFTRQFVEEPSAFVLRYYDEAFSVLRELDVTRFEGTPVGPLFRRGDVNADGRTATHLDAVLALGVIFGKWEPLCRKSVDVDDNGRLDLADVLLLLHDLRGHSLRTDASLFGCGVDLTPDALSCASTACGD